MQSKDPIYQYASTGPEGSFHLDYQINAVKAARDHRGFANRPRTDDYSPARIGVAHSSPVLA